MRNGRGVHGATTNKRRRRRRRNRRGNISRRTRIRLKIWVRDEDLKGRGEDNAENTGQGREDAKRGKGEDGKGG